MASGFVSDAEFEGWALDVNEAFNSGDSDAYLPFADPEIEFLPILAGRVEGDSFRGHDGIRRYFEQRAEFIESATIELDEVTRVAEDRVLLLGRWRIRGRGSGVESEGPWGGVAVVRDRRIVWTRGFDDQDQAREVAAQMRRDTGK